MVIAYLTGTYARASDTFIRDEVVRLRELGLEILTFSVRRPPASDDADPAALEERSRTVYLLDAGWWPLIGGGLAACLRRPVRCLRAARLAFRIAPPGPRGVLLSLAYFFEACELARHLGRLQVDHLHNHMGFNSAAVAMISSELTGVPYSLTIHGPDEFDSPREIALSAKVSRAKFTVAVSEYGRSQLMRWTPPSDWHRIHVVRCAVAERFAATPTLPAESPRFLFVGRLEPAKGMEVLVEAMKMVAKGGVPATLEVIGDGSLRERLSDAVARAGLGDSIRLRGWCSPRDVRAAILASRALILPSFAEGLPVVLMESLALGRPVITTQIAGIPELVSPACGWLVPAGSASELASAIREASLAPVDRIARMGASGAQVVAERHSGRVQSAALLSLFETAVRAPRVGGAMVAAS